MILANEKKQKKQIRITETSKSIKHRSLNITLIGDGNPKTH